MSTTAPDERTTTYNPTVATIEFPALFPIFSNSDLSVYVDREEHFNFTVTATYVEGVSTNARVVMAVGVIGEVLIVGARKPRRQNRFPNGGPLPVRDINLAFDVIQVEMQEANRDIERALKVPHGASGYSVQPEISEGHILVMRDGVISEGETYDGIEGSLAAAQQDAQESEASAQRSESARDESNAAVAVSAANAAASAESVGQAQNLVDQAQASYAGFQPGTLYDLGRVTDTVELFPSDLGRVVDL